MALRGGLAQLFSLLYALAGYTPASHGPAHGPASHAAVVQAALDAGADPAAFLAALRLADLDQALAAPGPAGAPPADPSGPAFISAWGLLLAALLVAINGAISVWLRLGLHGKLAVGAVRCVVQLSMLGYILVPIFTANNVFLSAGYAGFMLVVAAMEAVSRPARTYDGMLLQALVALGVPAAAIISYGLAVVVRPEGRWWDAQYLIPMLGMMLGNACSGVAVGLSAVLDELSTGRDKIEMLLAMGADRMEATREAVQRAIRLAMMPLLNQMAITGLVSVPGLMTGEILAGSDPAQAARYQIVIMFLLAATTALSAVGMVFAAVLSVVDSEDRLRPERLHPAASSGAFAWLGAQLSCAAQRARGRFGRLRAALRGAAAAGGAPPRGHHRFFAFRGRAAQDCEGGEGWHGEYGPAEEDGRQPLLGRQEAPPPHL